MKQYAFVEWDLVRSTPLKHTYRCGWRDMLLGSKAQRAARHPKRRHITLEWDGKDALTVRSGMLLPSKSRWTTDQLRSIVFGIREVEAGTRSSLPEVGWLWFIHLHGKSNGMQRRGVLAEFLVAHQNNAPMNSRARIPARVQELLNWLGQCTGHRVHGPVLMTDDEARKRILSQVD